MTNVLIIPAYRDQTGYIDSLTKPWHAMYGLDVHVHPFGTNDRLEDFDDNWQATKEAVEGLGQTAMIGISFGGGVSLRALQELPNNVTSVTCISAPLRLEDMDENKVNDKYRMLTKSLPAIDLENLPREKIQTFRSWRDPVITPRKSVIQGATNHRTFGLNHSSGIGSTLLFRSGTIAKFIKDRAN